MNFIFDVDDTLYDLTQPLKNAIKTLWGNQFSLDVEQLFTLTRKHGDALFPKIMRGEISLDDAGALRVCMAMEEMGYTIDQKEADRFQQCYRQSEYKISLSAEMRNLLDFLKDQHQTVGILTNGLTAHQQKKIDSLKLIQWVEKENIFISEAIHASKPDLKAFDHVEKAMDLNKSETYYIGDSPQHDVKGAIQAGWHMIFLNRRHRDVTTLPKRPDFIVTSESELSKLIKKITMIR